MPRVNIHIRQGEDWETYQRIKDRPKSVHTWMEAERILQSSAEAERKRLTPIPKDIKVIKSVGQATAATVAAVLAKPADGVKLCKIHQTPLDNRGKCLQKGCKYA